MEFEKLKRLIIKMYPKSSVQEIKEKEDISTDAKTIDELTLHMSRKLKRRVKSYE